MESQAEVTFHPLFPSDDDDDYPDISWIHVTRHEATGKVWYPYLFPAADLQTLEIIQQRFGGGRYELLARDIGKRAITARREYQIPGNPKPMVETTQAEAEQQKKANAPQVQQPTIQPTSDATAMMMQMMMQMMMAQQQSQTQMMLAFMNGSGDRSKEYVSSMQALHDRHAQATNAANERMITLITTLNQGGSRGSGEDFYKGVEFMREFAKAQVEIARASGGDSESGDKFLDTILEAIQGFQAFKDIQATANGVANGAAPTGN